MRTIRLWLLALLILAIPAGSFAQFGVSVTIAPPALPVYTQPMAPGADYLWTPGYASRVSLSVLVCPATSRSAGPSSLTVTLSSVISTSYYNPASRLPAVACDRFMPSVKFSSR
jgi:hypothetical protein